MCSNFFFFNDTATTEIYALSLHDALPICRYEPTALPPLPSHEMLRSLSLLLTAAALPLAAQSPPAARPTDVPSLAEDRKSTRLNSSHANISYAVFCLKKKRMKDLIHAREL